MLRLATPEHQRFSQTTSFCASFGGGEANVAVSLAKFGLDAEFVTRLPNNDLGNSVIMELKKHGVDTVFKDAYWFHWTGITPSISKGAAIVCQEAITAAKKRGIVISCDLNFRKNLWRWGESASEVMPGLVSDCDIILGNEEDAEKIFGLKPDNVNVFRGEVNGASYESVCRKLKKMFPRAKKIIITLRGSVSADHNTWSGVLYDGKVLYEAPVYQITHIVDRVGGGDSFMAGLIYGLLTYPNDDQKALNFAAAASCLKHTIHGDFNLVTVAEVEQLMKGDTSGRVIR